METAVAAVQVPPHIVTLAGADGLFAKQAEVFEKALARIDEIQKDQAYTPEHKGEKARELTDAALAAAAGLREGWERQVAACEATAQKEARDGAAVKTEIFQLAKSNGLALLNIMAELGSGEALQAEFEEVVQRGLPGEMNAWATALPLKVEIMAARDKTSPVRHSLWAVQKRCAEVLESMKSTKQREAEAKMVYLSGERQRVERMERLQGGSLSGLRHRVQRLRGVPGAGIPGGTGAMGG